MLLRRAIVESTRRGTAAIPPKGSDSTFCTRRSGKSAGKLDATVDPYLLEDTTEVLLTVSDVIPRVVAMSWLR